MPSIASHVERIAAHRYSFTSTWDLPVERSVAFAVLADLWTYPAWWPEFKRADRLSDDHGVFALRSALPLTLNFTLTRDVEDEAAGLLRANADGDITGTVEWKLVDDGPVSCMALFTQEVTLNHPIARRTDFALRPILSWNHSVAMSSGHGGILASLAAQ